MEFRPVKIKNPLLKEGETYVFRLMGKLNSGIGVSSFIVMDPFGYKMLMKAEYYLDYGFREGQEVICRVDKISCSGRIYLEPQHPCYKEGEIFSFKVLSLGYGKGLRGLPEWYYRVEDCLGKEWRVRCNSVDNIHAVIPQKIDCLVEHIKKGRLFLRLPEIPDYQSHLKQEMVYPFLILDETINPDDSQAYFILKDKTGSRHLIRKKYYPHYDLRKGQEILCRVDGRLEDGSVFLEPLNPVYDIGKDYWFHVIGLEEYIFSDDSRQKLIILKDTFGEEIKVQVNESDAASWASCKQLRCRVIRIWKSRLEVKILEGNLSD